jgi:hypothetical protein
LAEHLLEEYLTRVINETDAAEIHAKLGTRCSGMEFAPALLKSGYAGAREAALDAEQELSAFGFGGDS